MKLILCFILTFLINYGVYATTYYQAPDGSDSYTTVQAQDSETPWKTFAKSFGEMVAEDELILLDGDYGEVAGTGYIHYVGTGSGQIPSGTSKTQPTIVRANTSGNVTVTGQLFIGRSTRKDSFIKVRGIEFIGGAHVYNSNYVYLKECGFRGKDGNGSTLVSVGTNDHDEGNTYNLIEDCWIWGTDYRIIASNYRADYNVWRRVVVRGDGCDYIDCAGSGNPNVGITVYNSKYCSIQNVIVIDRIRNGGYSYADFATAQHDGAGPETFLEGNEWLGCLSVNSDDRGYNMECDNAISPSHYLKNCVYADDTSPVAGFEFDKTKGLIIENSTSLKLNSAETNSLFRHGDASTGQVSRSLLGLGNGQWAVVRGGTASYIDTFGTYSDSRYYSTTVSPGELTTDPTNDGSPVSLLYPVRIEEGSALKGTGYNSSDYGANIINKYGEDGTFYNDTDYNTLTSNALWPWDNEARIKTQMSVDYAESDETRGFCTTGNQLDESTEVTLTSYIYEYIDNQMPPDVYGDPESSSIGPGDSSTFSSGDSTVIN